MVESVIRPVSWSAGKPVRGVRSVAAYAPYKQLSHLLNQIKTEEEEEQPATERESSPSETVSWIEDALGDSNSSELELFFDQEYQAWVRFFLTPHHDEILAIRSRIRQGEGEAHGEGSSHLLPVRYSETERPRLGSSVTHEERNRLYHIQMQLYQTEKGLHCHLIV